MVGHDTVSCDTVVTSLGRHPMDFVPVNTIRQVVLGRDALVIVLLISMIVQWGATIEPPG